MTRLERAQIKMGKQKAHAFRHTAERARERYGLELEQSDYRKAERAIRTGQVPLELKHRAGETTVTVIVKLKGKRTRVVYCLASERIVTVLPLVPARP